MKYKIVKLLFALVAIFAIVAGCLFYAIYISPENIKIKYESYQSTKIPSTLDNVTIGYFSDLYLYEFLDDKRFDDMIQELNENEVDVLLFGGDLFATTPNKEIDADTINHLTQSLSKLHAPLGKFYVLGENDSISEDRKTLVNTILYNSGFENLTNRNVKIHNGSNEGINLIGLDNSINGNVDIQSAFTNISNESFNLLFTHTPDSITYLSNDFVDLAIAGHSLGGQIKLPFIGSLNPKDGALTYSNGTYQKGKTKILISNGIGTTGTDMRLLCPPQFNIIILSKK